MRTGITGIHRADSLKEEWLTPPHILAALGSFDLDPCAACHQPWPTARQHFTIIDDGLKRVWRGRVWCNPPYGKQTTHWLKRLADHGNGIALTFARTETVMFFEQIWGKANALLFIEGRLHFHHANGGRAKLNAGGPSVLVAYGRDNVECLRACEIRGQFIELARNNGPAHTAAP